MSTAEPATDGPVAMELSRSDISAFDDLFRSEYRSLVRLAYLMVGSQERAEELTQDAFAQLFASWAKVERPGGFVRTALVSRCRDAQRREIRGKAKLRLVTPKPEDVPESHYLVDALAELPHNWRVMVVLRYYGGHTIPEIAEITGDPEGSVKSGLHRALAQLKTQLQT